MRWWFLLKGDENILKKLEEEWEKIQLQTKWKLECCLAPSSELNSSQNCAENITNACTNTTTGTSTSSSQQVQPQSSPGSTSTTLTDTSGGVTVNDDETQHEDQTVESNHPENVFLERLPVSQQLIS